MANPGVHVSKLFFSTAKSLNDRKKVRYIITAEIKNVVAPKIPYMIPPKIKPIILARLPKLPANPCTEP